MLRSRLVGSFIVVLIAISALTLWVAPATKRLCDQPSDIGVAGQAPGWLIGINGRDEIAYPAHVILGTALEQFRCDPAATGLQWLKAGAHARSADEAARAAEGLAVVRRRSSIDHVLCSMLGGSFARPEQALVVAKAGLVCDFPRSPDGID